eukprot:scaffold126345_cov24-Phaeocystis_antarctica.AAC.2
MGGRQAHKLSRKHAHVPLWHATKRRRWPWSETRISSTRARTTCSDGQPSYGSALIFFWSTPPKMRLAKERQRVGT